MGCCPTCNQAMPDTSLAVCLDSNVFIWGGIQIKLSRREAEIASVLTTAYPRCVPLGEIIRRVYGIAEVASAESVTHVHLCYLRKKLAASGVHLPAIRGRGYRLELGELPKPAVIDPRQAGPARRVA
jgi:DNA-binding response OmpR family regulator